MGADEDGWTAGDCIILFFFNDTATTEIYTLSLHDALPILTVERVERQVLDTLVGDVKHQGVVAESQNQAAMDEKSFLDWLDKSDAVPFLLILDGVQDPHNLGACLRTAEAVGVQAIIAPRDNACGLTSTVRKVSCGAAELVPFVQVTNLARFLRTLQDKGVFLIGTAAEAEISLYQADLRGPVGLEIGRASCRERV